MTDSHERETFNPCFCIPLRTGATAAAIFDFVYGTVYILRIEYLGYLMWRYPAFFPEKFPRPTDSPLMHWMFVLGNYILMILSGIILLASAQYLGDYYKVLRGLCYFYLTLRVFLIVSLAIFSNALFAAYQVYLNRLGTEVLLSIVVQFYFICVVFYFIRDSRLWLNNKRAIKPLIIAKREHEAYLSGKPTMFNNAMSFHTLLPNYFLKTVKAGEVDDDEDEESVLGLHMDESMLQYVAAKERVKVKSEKEARMEMRHSRIITFQSVPEDEETEKEEEVSSVITLKSFTKSVSEVEEETSVAPSDMSVFPDVEEVAPSFMDMNEPESEMGSSLFEPSQSAEIAVADVDAPSEEIVEPEPEPPIVVEEPPPPPPPPPPPVKKPRPRKPKPPPVIIEEPPPPPPVIEEPEPEPEPPKPPEHPRRPKKEGWTWVSKQDRRI